MRNIKLSEIAAATYKIGAEKPKYECRHVKSKIKKPSKRAFGVHKPRNVPKAGDWQY